MNVVNYEVMDSVTGKSMGIFASRAHAARRYRGDRYVITTTDKPVNVWQPSVTF